MPRSSGLPRCDGSNVFSGDAYATGTIAVGDLFPGDTTNPPLEVTISTDAAAHYYLVAYASGDYKTGSIDSNKAACWPGTKWAHISALKFFDTDADGVRDDGECEILGWPFSLVVNGGTPTTITSGGSATEILFGASYCVSETLPTNWVNTTPTSVCGTIDADHTEVVTTFGNRPNCDIDCSIVSLPMTDWKSRTICGNGCGPTTEPMM